MKYSTIIGKLLYSLRNLPLGRYKPYYISDKNIFKESFAQEIVKLAEKAYSDPYFDRRYQRIMDDHLSVKTAINWARSIKDDLLSSSTPITRVQNWDNYLHNNIGYMKLSVFFSHYIDFEEHELAFLWGLVYYWLKFGTEKFDNDSLLENIEKTACKKVYAIPYFMYLKNQGNIIFDEYDNKHINEQSYQSSTTKKMTVEQTAILALGICRQMNINISNKKSLAPLIHKICGYSENTLSQKLTGGYKQDDLNKIADIIDPLLPEMAANIRKKGVSNPWNHEDS